MRRNRSRSNLICFAWIYCWDKRNRRWCSLDSKSLGIGNWLCMINEIIYVIKNGLFIGAGRSICDAFWVWCNTIYEKAFVTFAEKNEYAWEGVPDGFDCTENCHDGGFLLLTQSFQDNVYLFWRSLYLKENDKPCLIYITYGFRYLIVAINDLQEILVDLVHTGMIEALLNDLKLRYLQTYILPFTKWKHPVHIFNFVGMSQFRTFYKNAVLYFPEDTKQEPATVLH